MTSVKKHRQRVYLTQRTLPIYDDEPFWRRAEIEATEVLVNPEDAKWMREALDEARKAERHGDVPIGAVVVYQGGIIGRGHNRREADGDPLAHAELLALREAAKALGRWRLIGCQLYVTLEPCPMCAGALVNSRIDRVIFGATDPKAGYCGSLANVAQDTRLNHQAVVTGGVLAEASSTLLKAFFRTLRGKRRKPKTL